MPKVKIIWCQNFSYNYDYQEIARHIPAGDFEEITDEQLDTLRKGLAYIRRPHQEVYPHIVLLDAPSLESRVEEIFEAVKAREAAAEAAAEKRRMAKIMKSKTKEEQRRAQFEALKKEFEG